MADLVVVGQSTYELGRWAAAARVLLAAGIAVSVIGALSEIQGLHKLSILLAYDRAFGDPEVVVNRGLIQPISALEWVVPPIGTYVLVVFLARALLNVCERAGSSVLPRPRWTHWSAIVFTARSPDRAVEAIWRASPGSSNPPPSIQLVWITWVICNVSVHFADRLSLQAHTIGEARVATWLELIVELGFAITGVLLFRVVRATTTRTARMPAAVTAQARP